MAEDHYINGTGSSLQSTSTRNLLDIVDNLRSQGISRYIDLPEIIVCGEQSSGKSSVLEAISGISFPSKDNLCTRFATELILRRGPDAPVKVRIVPGKDELRSDAEKEKVRGFGFEVNKEDMQLEEVIEKAKEAMSIDDVTKVFSSDILRLEVCGPEQPHLTLVDLPGLFQAGSRAQSDADSDRVKKLVLGYMRSVRSVILAVVSAKNDFNNQSITRYAREIDPKGSRTLGLITKPDTLDEGSDMERFYVELAQNKEVKFRLGWHVLRNRDYAARNASLQERNRVEEEFFTSGVWRSLRPSQVGVHSLRPRLSKILKDQILAQLPQVLTQIYDGMHDCTSRLNVLGASRATTQEQRRYLLQISHSFSNLIKAASDGLYSDPFFGDASTTEGYQKRLRAILQNTLTDFAESMHNEGHTYDIIDQGPLKFADQITRKDYILKVKTLLKRSRGRELPGTFNPLIITHLFHEQREPWANLIASNVDKIVSAVYKVVRSALAHVTDESTLSALLTRFIYPRLESLTAALQDKVAELLKPHDTGHPITYNHYLTENVQKAQSKRRTREIERSLKEFLGGDYTGRPSVALNINVGGLLDLLVSKTEADMNDYASSTATDFMEAYYKVALKRVIDDFSVLAVEACLIEKLPTLFCPSDVLDIDEAMVAAIAAEDEESSAERARCTEKLEVLENGLKALRGMQGYTAVGLKDATDPEYSSSESDGSEVAPSDEVSVNTEPTLKQTPPDETVEAPEEPVDECGPEEWPASEEAPMVAEAPSVEVYFPVEAEPPAEVTAAKDDPWGAIHTLKKKTKKRW